MGARLRKVKNKKATYLQSQCTNNQRFFGNSEEAEFFAAFLLVFRIFFRNFKSQFSESYKTKSLYICDAETRRVSGLGQS